MKKPQFTKSSSFGLLWKFALVTLVILIAIGLLVSRLDQKMQKRIAEGWFLPPQDFYSRPLRIEPGLQLKAKQLEQILLASGYNQADSPDLLPSGHFFWLSAESCASFFNEELPISRCIKLRKSSGEGDQVHLIVFGPESEVLYVTDQDTETLPSIELAPVLFAQFYGSKAVLRQVLDLGQIPVSCLQAVTAIEDEAFLEHRGVSITGTLRAVFRNLTEGRYAQGGSTITQQLVKNYFLNPEKTFRRKLTEQIMALILEVRFSKDKILENYLNVIYMGQKGPFQVRGFGSASQYYFGKNISQLNLADCALLAAIINSPGRYNPFRKPELAKKRRSLVLTKMKGQGYIGDSEYEEANLSALPKKPSQLLTEPAPYLIQALKKEVDKLEISNDRGLKIYTNMDLMAQQLAQESVRDGIKHLESRFPQIAKNKKDGKLLQAGLIAVDLAKNEVIALVGGRNFRQTQFNRVTEAKRQVGSVMKPFVYLAALESEDEEGKTYGPMTPLLDEEFVYEYEGQTWKPRNYDGRFRGEVPLFYALKESLNVPTARLATTVGLGSVIDVALRAGVQSELKEYPSVALGAFEIKMVEVAQAYSTIARYGQFLPLEFFRSIQDQGGSSMLDFDFEPEQRFREAPTAILVSMLTQTLKTGTARSAQAWGFKAPAAGKTGTTSDSKDAWFAGFTPRYLCIVWVGYDNNLSTGLSGASGAIPIWSQFMRGLTKLHGTKDFQWPASGVRMTEWDLESLSGVLPLEKDRPAEEQLQILDWQMSEGFN